MSRTVRTGGCVGLAMVLLCTFGAPEAFAQDGDPRPRVGLALGGGGARGLAHVGVLRALEELRVPVDFIAGTSIGAVIGGLYASGVPLDEIERRIADVRWPEVLRGRPSRINVNYRRKQEDRLFPVQLELGLGGPRGLRLPPGLLSGQRLEVLLGGLTLPVADITEFDDLPIPFRAVATDAETGEMMILQRGDLIDAVRASMAIPGVFPPVELNGRILLDGGVSRPLPVDVVQDMGADVVIAVDVSTPLTERGDLQDFIGLTAQVIRLPLRAETARQVERLDAERDVLVVPDLEGFNAASFDAYRDLFAAGRAAALHHAALLTGHTLTPSAWIAERARRSAPRLDLPRIRELRIENGSGIATPTLRAQVWSRPGEVLSFARLSADLSRIFGLGWFESVSFRLEPVDGHPDSADLVIRVVPKPWGPRFVRFGIGLQDNLDGNPSLQLLASLTLSQLNGWGGELRTEVQIGGPRSIRSEFYQPLGPVAFVATDAFVSREIRDVFTDGRRSAQFREVRSGLGVDVGAVIGRFGELRGGLFTGRVDTDTRIGIPDTLDAGDRTGGLRARLGVDRLDDRSFPLEGVALDAEWTWVTPSLGADHRYYRAEARALQAVPIGSGALLLAAEAGSDLGGGLPFYEAFGLGGLRRISGIRPREETGHAFGLGRLFYYRPVARLASALPSGRLFLGVSAEAGRIWREDEARTRVGGSLFVGLETVLGPLNLAYGRADRGQDAWYLSLGLTF